MEEQNNTTVAEVKALRLQLEERIFEVVRDFEEITGMNVTGIDVRHERKPGFGECERIEVDVRTEL